MRTDERTAAEREFGAMGWFLPACMALVLASAAAALAQSIAEGGSPLYSIAVEEAIRGLENSGKRETPAQKPCPKCGKLHVAGGAENQGTNHLAVAAAPGQPCSQCGKVHSAHSLSVTNRIPAANGLGLPASGAPCPHCGKIHTAAEYEHAADASASAPEGYYYCTNCKAYHMKGPVSAVVPAP